MNPGNFAGFANMKYECPPWVPEWLWLPSLASGLVSGQGTRSLVATFGLKILQAAATELLRPASDELSLFRISASHDTLFRTIFEVWEQPPVANMLSSCRRPVLWLDRQGLEPYVSNPRGMGDCCTVRNGLSDLSCVSSDMCCPAVEKPRQFVQLLLHCICSSLLPCRTLRQLHWGFVDKACAQVCTDYLSVSDVIGAPGSHLLTCTAPAVVSRLLLCSLSVNGLSGVKSRHTG